MADFFVSYTKADRTWATWIAWQLEEAGYGVLIQEWDFRPGGNFVLEMQKGAQARRTIAVLSQRYLDALYTQPEWAAAFAQDPTGGQGTLLPVRVEKCDLTGLLKPIIYIDLVDRDEEDAKETLLAGVKQGRGKPVTAPAFPGAKRHSVPKPEQFPGDAMAVPQPAAPPAAASPAQARQPCAVVLTALRSEFKAVAAHLSDLQRVSHPQGTLYERGTFSPGTRSWQVVLVETGPGNPAAAIEAERAISHFDPQVVLFVGVAGGIKDVKIGDVVATTKVYGYESGKAGVTFLPRPEVYRSTHRMEQQARAEARRDDWLWRIGGTVSDPAPAVFVGPIAAGEQVVAETRSETYQFLRSNYGDALAVEMEGRGFLQAAHVNRQVDALVIRGVSDLIDKKSEADAAGSQDLAARHASAFAFEVLANLEVGSQPPANP